MILEKLSFVHFGNSGVTENTTKKTNQRNEVDEDNSNIDNNTNQMKIGIALSVTLIVIAAIVGTLSFWKRKANKGNKRFETSDHDHSTCVRIYIINIRNKKNILPAKLSKAEMNELDGDYEGYEISRKNNQNGKKVIENPYYGESSESGVHDNVKVSQNPYYDGHEQLDCPKSIVKIENPYYGEEEMLSNGNVKVSNNPYYE